MHAVADTNQLVRDGIISTEQATDIETRAREVMVSLVINVLLAGGILAASGGLILWLADALMVALCGTISLALGYAILKRKSEVFWMFGNAAFLVGAGMLIGGASLEMMENYTSIGPESLIVGGALVSAVSIWALTQGSRASRFVSGAVLLMGGAVHLGGIYLLLEDSQATGLIVSFAHLYCVIALIMAGWITNIRTITALAIVPFAQLLDAGTFYSEAVYVFYSYESTLTILQMSGLIALCIWVANRWPERIARHARVLAVLAFVTANLCALVGSLWGDVIGQSLWGPGEHSRNGYKEWQDALELFTASTLVISKELYSILWAVSLGAIVIWASHKNQRGLFNAAMTFAGIHAYTQLFTHFGDEPLAFAIGGLATIPVAWAMWQANHWLKAKEHLAAM